MEKYDRFTKNRRTEQDGREMSMRSTDDFVALLKEKMKIVPWQDRMVIALRDAVIVLAEEVELLKKQMRELKQ